MYRSLPYNLCCCELPGAPFLLCSMESSEDREHPLACCSRFPVLLWAENDSKEIIANLIGASMKDGVKTLKGKDTIRITAGSERGLIHHSGVTQMVDWFLLCL